MRVHLFPSRTQKLSSFAPTILGGRLPGKIGNANTSLSRKTGAFFCLKRATGTFLNGMRPRHFLRCTLAAIPDLSGKLDNANRMPDGKIGAFASVTICWTAELDVKALMKTFSKKFVLGVDK